MGVAIVGSVFASLFGPEIRQAFAPFLAHGLSAAQIRVAQSSMQAAKRRCTLSRRAAAAPHQRDTDAFMDGLHRACLVAAASPYSCPSWCFDTSDGQRAGTEILRPRATGCPIRRCRV